MRKHPAFRRVWIDIVEMGKVGRVFEITERGNPVRQRRLGCPPRMRQRVQERACSQQLSSVRADCDADPTTALLGRAAFDATLATALAQAGETRQPLSVMLCDLDYFAAFNENFGNLVYNTRIRKTVRYAEAPVKGQSVLKYEPSGEAATMYRELAKEVLKNGEKSRQHA